MKGKQSPLDMIMGVEEAAEKWGVSTRYVSNLCADGIIKSVKINSTWVMMKNAKYSRRSEKR